MKVWTDKERLKYIKHLADQASNEARRLTGQERPQESAEVLEDAMTCIRLLATGSDQALDENSRRIARYLA